MYTVRMSKLHIKKITAPKVPKIKMPHVPDPTLKAMTPMQSGLIGALKQGKRVAAKKFAKR